MSERANLQSLEPTGPAQRRLRKRLTLRGELPLALLPTRTVPGVLATAEVVTGQRLNLASLAPSAFLIYLDPEHGTNSTRTLILDVAKRTRTWHHPTETVAAPGSP